MTDLTLEIFKRNETKAYSTFKKYKKANLIKHRNR